MAENKFEVVGRIFEFGELKEFKNDYKKRDVLVELTREWNGSVYKDVVKFIADKNNVDRLAMFTIGEEVTIGFSLSGRMWQAPDKETPVNFTELKIIFIAKMEQSQTVASPEPITMSTPAETSSQQVQDIGVMITSPAPDFDDLPF